MFRWRAVKLLSLLAGLTKRDPHAIIAIDVDPGQPVHVSRSELWRRTLQLRADLATAGVGRGDGVAVWLPNWSHLLDWHVAAASLGAHVVGLGPDTPAGDAARVIERARPRVVAIAPRFRDLDPAGRLRDALAQGGTPVPAVAVVAGPHNRPPIDPSPWDFGGGAWLPSATTAGMPMPVTKGDELAVAFGPDLAAHRESAIVRHALSAAEAIGIRDDDLVACAEPLTSAFGLGIALAALAGGATCLLEPSCDDEDTLLDDMARFGATQLAAGDDVVLRLADAFDARRRELGTWRWLGIAAVLGRAQEAATWAEKEFGITVSGVYGSAELLAPVAVWPQGHPAPDRWQPGGLPVSPQIEVRVADPVSGLPVPDGTQGELQFRGFTVAEAHLGAASTGSERTGEDWLRTGDLGVRTDDGGFHHLGRIAGSTL
ncbi:AMP-binding protein [Saccharomonospora sp. NPDC046836]|uniref:AMP-binding protein n=1 Tax=Saccharomonospora sp. NPDC046836 TaxID=3156921 RepID=UPI0033EEDBAD